MTRINFDIKLALLLNIAEAQSSKGKLFKEFLIVSLSISILNSLNLVMQRSIRIKSLSLSNYLKKTLIYYIYNDRIK